MAERRGRGAVEVTLQDLGSIGELVGALATIATLVYLAIQIRANTRATLAEARRTTLHHRTSAVSDLIANEDVARIFEQGLADRDSLKSTDRIRFDFFFARMLSYTELQVLEEREGLATAESIELGVANLGRWLRTPGGRRFWERQRGSYGADLQRRIDAILAADD